MRKIEPRLDLWTLVALALTCLVFAVAGVEGLLHSRRIAANGALVAHTYEVMDQLHTLVATVADAETGQRGFLVTDDDAYLAPYIDARARLDRELERLSTLTAGNPVQQQRLRELRPHLSLKMVEMEEIAELRKTDGFRAAQARTRMGIGRHEMDHIRSTVASMLATEQELLVLRARESSESYYAEVAATVVSAGAGIVLVGVLYFRLRAVHIDRTIAAAALYAEKEQVRTTLLSIADGVIVTDAAGRIAFLNPVAETMTGWTTVEAAGRPLEDVFTIVDEVKRDPVPLRLARVIEEGATQGLESRGVLVARNGAERLVDEAGAPIRDEHGLVTGAVLVFHDITEARRVEEALVEASRLKDEFLAMVSHELRTPLNAILGWTQMLRTGAVAPERVSRGVEIIDRNARTQWQLVSDLLDISRVIKGTLRIDPIPIPDAGVVVRAALDSVRPAADAKEIALGVDVPPGVGPVFGDPVRLQQIVWNLLNNAVKFTPMQGSVQVRLALRDSQVELAVSDTGPGIPAPLVPVIFDRFRQGDSGLARSAGGLGLGLAIVKELVSLHGGTVAVDAGGAGQGATFSVRLPLFRTAAVETSAESAVRTHG